MSSLVWAIFILDAEMILAQHTASDIWMDLFGFGGVLERRLFACAAVVAA